MFRSVTPFMLAASFGMVSMLSAQPAETPPQSSPGRTPPQQNQFEQPQDEEERRTVRRVSPDDPGFQLQSDEKTLAGVLALGNKLEIEIAELAVDKTQTREVRQFAQQMIDHHGEFLEKLHRFAPERSAATRDEDPQPSAEQAAVPREQDRLEEVRKRAAAYKLSFTRQVLEQHEGREFDKCFVGQQVFAHIDMLAALQAMQEEGTAEFQDLVREGIEMTKAHLTEARELAKQLEHQDRDTSGTIRSGVQPAPAETP